MSTKHETVSDVIRTIREQIALDRGYVKVANKLANKNPVGIASATGSICAYQNCLTWLLDLEEPIS